MVEKRSAHRKALEKIALNYSKIGIPKVISSTIEKNLFHQEKLIAQPDVIFECSNREVHIIEYKANGNGELLRRAQIQLQNAVFWYGKYKDIEPEQIHTLIISGSDPKYSELLK
jgi:hypothetical protein